MFVSPFGLGRKQVRIVVCWYFGSDATLKSRIDSNWEIHIQNENSASATSQRFSSLRLNAFDNISGGAFRFSIGTLRFIGKIICIVLVFDNFHVIMLLSVK